MKCVWRLELNILSLNKQHVQDLSQPGSFKINDKNHGTQHVKSNDSDRSSHRVQESRLSGGRLCPSQVPFSPPVWDEQLPTVYACGGTQNGGSYYLLFKSEREILFLPIIAQLRHEQVVSLLSWDLLQGNDKCGIQSLKIFACSWVYPNIHQGFLVVVQSRWYVNNTWLSKKKNP